MSVHISLSRVYFFSSAHRLNSPKLSEAENVEIYDKCNNIHGHGHDYKVEVTVKGLPDNDTGMIISLSKLDSIVDSLIKKLDHKHLDYEVVYFRENLSTGEVIVQFIWEELNRKIPDGLLYHLKLWETNNNYFEIGEEQLT